MDLVITIWKLKGPGLFLSVFLISETGYLSDDRIDGFNDPQLYTINFV